MGSGWKPDFGALIVVGNTERRSATWARGQARATIIVETRTYARRDGDAEEVCQISLDRQRLKLRWGPRGQGLRVQSLVFNSVAEARAAYFERVDQLEARGYLDGTAG